MTVRSNVLNFVERYLPPWASGALAGSITALAQLEGAPDVSNLLNALQHTFGTEPNLAWLPAPCAAALTYIARRSEPPTPTPTPTTPTPTPLTRRPSARRTQAIPTDIDREVDTRARLLSIEEAWRRISDRQARLSDRVAALERQYQSPSESVDGPLNIRQNNPLNIVATDPSRTPWHGEIPSENRFALFERPEDGLRAAMYLLVLVYFQRYKLLTIREIVLRWAPPASRGGDNTDNETAAYIRRVAVALDAPEDRLLQLDTDYEELIGLVRAMGEVEGGAPLPYPDATYARAVMALPTTQVSDELVGSARRVLGENAGEGGDDDIHNHTLF